MIQVLVVTGGAAVAVLIVGLLIIKQIPDSSRGRVGIAVIIAVTVSAVAILFALRQAGCLPVPEEIAKLKQQIEEFRKAVYKPVFAAKSSWEPYGNEFQPGEYEIFAHGRWSVGDTDIGGLYGPEGSSILKTQENCPKPGERIGALIVAIVPSAQVVQGANPVPNDQSLLHATGDHYLIPIDKPSRLFFIMNDNDWPLSKLTAEGVDGFQGNLGACFVAVVPKVILKE